MSTTASTGPMSDDELRRQKTLAEITRMNEETMKFVAEARKLSEESLKFGTERRTHGYVVGAAIAGATASLMLLLLRLLGLI